MACTVALYEGSVVGGVVMHTMNVTSARRRGELSFDLLEGQTEATLAAYIMLLAVGAPYRRQGVGSELIYHGTMQLGARLDGKEGLDLGAVRRGWGVV